MICSSQAGCSCSTTCKSRAWLPRCRGSAAAGGRGDPQLSTREEALIADIAALDEAYENGELEEEDYQNRREALKNALRQRMSR
ncbi:MAG: hypothetical protein HC915_21555 [Anaerolineae bacterium]|nr:hypothetical protein [Anaerolineae bacterium]